MAGILSATRPAAHRGPAEQDGLGLAEGVRRVAREPPRVRDGGILGAAYLSIVHQHVALTVEGGGGLKAARRVGIPDVLVGHGRAAGGIVHNLELVPRDGGERGRATAGRDGRPNVLVAATVLVVRCRHHGVQAERVHGVGRRGDCRRREVLRHGGDEGLREHGIRAVGPVHVKRENVDVARQAEARDDELRLTRDGDACKDVVGRRVRAEDVVGLGRALVIALLRITTHIEVLRADGPARLKVVLVEHDRARVTGGVVAHIEAVGPNPDLIVVRKARHGYGVGGDAIRAADGVVRESRRHADLVRRRGRDVHEEVAVLHTVVHKLRIGVGRLAVAVRAETAKEVGVVERGREGSLRRARSPRRRLAIEAHVAHGGLRGAVVVVVHEGCIVRRPDRAVRVGRDGAVHGGMETFEVRRGGGRRGCDGGSRGGASVTDGRDIGPLDIRHHPGCDRASVRVVETPNAADHGRRNCARYGAAGFSESSGGFCAIRRCYDVISREVVQRVGGREAARRIRRHLPRPYSTVRLGQIHRDGRRIVET